MSNTSSNSDLLYNRSCDPLRLALRPKEMAKVLGIGERKLWELTNRNEIPCVRIGRRVLYPVDLVREWLAKQATKGGTK